MGGVLIGMPIRSRLNVDRNGVALRIPSHQHRPRSVALRAAHLRRSRARGQLRHTGWAPGAARLSARAEFVRAAVVLERAAAVAVADVLPRVEVRKQRVHVQRPERPLEDGEEQVRARGDLYRCVSMREPRREKSTAAYEAEVEHGYDGGPGAGVDAHDDEALDQLPRPE